MKTYIVTFWYGGYALEWIRVTARNKRQVRTIMYNQFGKNIEIVSIEKDA